MSSAHPIYLLRHGQTEWNAERRVQGALDSPLTAHGVVQARNMGRALQGLVLRQSNWDLVASPLGRAACTAGIIAGMLDLPLRFDARLREISLGIWDGMLADDVKARFPDAERRLNWTFHSPDGESFAEVAARGREWLSSITGPTIAVAHGILGYVVRNLYLGQDELRDEKAHTSQDGIYSLRDGRIEFIACTQ